MILLAAGVVLLVIAAAVSVVLSRRAAVEAQAAADEVRASVDQLVDIAAQVFLDAEEADGRRARKLAEALERTRLDHEAHHKDSTLRDQMRSEHLQDQIAALNAHKAALGQVQEQAVAVRKQVKHLLTQAAQINATHRRYLLKQRAVLEMIAHMHDDPGQKTETLALLRRALEDDDG